MARRINQNRHNVEVGLIVAAAHQLGVDAAQAAQALGFPVTQAAIAKAAARLTEQAA